MTETLISIKNNYTLDFSNDIKYTNTLGLENINNYVCDIDKYMSNYIDSKNFKLAEEREKIKNPIIFSVRDIGDNNRKEIHQIDINYDMIDIKDFNEKIIYKLIDFKINPDKVKQWIEIRFNNCLSTEKINTFKFQKYGFKLINVPYANRENPGYHLLKVCAKKFVSNIDYESSEIKKIIANERRIKMRENMEHMKLINSRNNKPLSFVPINKE